MKCRLLPIVILTLTVALGGATRPAAAASDGAKPSVTVFPVVTTPNRFPDELTKRVAIVIATFLEKAGLVSWSCEFICPIWVGQLADPTTRKGCKESLD
jgi:hypothetical protein